jgi:hypothetical protein
VIAWQRAWRPKPLDCPAFISLIARRNKISKVNQKKGRKNKKERGKNMERRGEVTGYELLLEERAQDSQFPRIGKESPGSGGSGDADEL